MTLHGLPRSWRTVRLSEVADIVSGVTKGRRFTEPTVCVPYLRVANVQAGYLDLGEVKEIDVLRADVDKLRLQRGDILLTEGGDFDKLGRGTMWDGEIECCVHQNHIFRVRVDRDSVFPEYLSAFLGSRLAKSYFLRCAKQTTGIASVNRTQLSGLPLVLPPLPEQRRIAAILDKADAIRRKRQEAIRLTDQLLRSAFLDMFGDPVTNPKGWPTERLGDVATLDRGRSRHRPRDAAFLYGGPYPSIQTGEIANSDGYITSYIKTYSELGLAQSKLWPTGTLCLTIAANIAKTSVLTFDACFPDSVVGLVPGDQLTTEYVRYWFVAMEKAIDALATQVAQKKHQSSNPSESRNSAPATRTSGSLLDMRGENA